MASTYSDLKIELIGTGEQVGTWGATTNVNLGTALEEAMVESADVAFSSSDVTLTLTNTNATQSARHLRLNLTGTSGGARNLILGSGCQIEKPYIINNGLADTVTVKNTTGTGIDVPAGKSFLVYNNGTNVVNALNGISVESGGTGLSTLTANNVIIGNGTSAVGFVAPGSSGNLLTSNGTTWTSAAAPTAFLTGMIILWSGSIGSIPAGFALCDGTSGTPDLRDRFIVGAGSTYAVDATGGSADATLPTHTHTATSTSSSVVTDPGHFHTIIETEAVAAGGNTGYRDAGPSTGATSTETTGITVATTTTTTNANAGTSGTNANLPPYYALAYIMKT
jgi:microcystin-dependent protein